MTAYFVLFCNFISNFLFKYLDVQSVRIYPINMSSELKMNLYYCLLGVLMSCPTIRLRAIEMLL